MNCHRRMTSALQKQPVALAPLSGGSGPVTVPGTGDEPEAVAVSAQQPAFVEVQSLPNGKLQYRPKQFHPERLPLSNLTVAMGDDDSDDKKADGTGTVNDKALLVAAFLQSRFGNSGSGRGMIVLGQSRHQEFFQSAGISGGYIHPAWDDKTQKKLEDFLSEQQHRVQLAKVDPTVSCGCFLVFHDLSENYSFSHSKLLQKVVSSMDTLQLHILITVTRPMALPPEIRQAVKCLAVHRQNNIQNMEKMHRIWFSRIPFSHYQQMVEQVTQTSQTPRVLIWDAYKHEIRWFAPCPQVVASPPPGSALSATTPQSLPPVWGESVWRQYGHDHYLDPTKPVALNFVREKIHQVQQEIARTEHYVARMQHLPTHDRVGRDKVQHEWEAQRPALPMPADMQGRISALVQQ